MIGGISLRNEPMRSIIIIIFFTGFFIGCIHNLENQNEFSLVKCESIQKSVGSFLTENNTLNSIYLIDLSIQNTEELKYYDNDVLYVTSHVGFRESGQSFLLINFYIDTDHGHLEIV